MDLSKCSLKHRSCCTQKTAMGSETDSDNYINESFIFAGWKNTAGNNQTVVSTEPISITTSGNGRNEYSKVPLGTPIVHQRDFTFQSVESNKPAGNQDTDFQNKRCFQEEQYYQRISEDRSFLCPRCGRKMQEPRLLPCLHPICSPCVSELMNSTSYISTNNIRNNLQFGRISNYCERCSLCDFRLPNSNSATPPPHYPLQHRLVMDAIRCKYANRILCDVCINEVLATVQCSTCLRNFCSNCGIEHEEQVTVEMRPMKHCVRPLWEATRVRRTALCQLHPAHALRFYCVACQQVTCKECMWSPQHRGHASENAAGAGKRAALYLTTILQRAKTLLNSLLTQYNSNVFSNSALCRQNTRVSIDHRYVTQTICSNLMIIVM